MDIKTEEQQITTIRFFNDEVRHYINHPADLVQALTRATGIVPSQILLAEEQPAAKTKRRKQVKPTKHQSNFSTDGYAGHTPRPVRVKLDVKPARVQERKPCPYGCGEMIKPSGVGPHSRKCPRFQLQKAAAKAAAKAAGVSTA